MNLRPAGDRSYLVELGTNAEVHAVAAAARTRYGGRIADVVPGERTVLLSWAAAGELPPALDVQAMLARSGQHAHTDPDPSPDAMTRIAVRYDGPDLDDVAAATGLSREGVIALHRAATYTVAFTGFAPGFAYMTGSSPQLHLPRRDQPRPRVPAGSVAIATTYTAIYPTPSPGGWHLLGRTDAVLFDAARTPPALLEPGARVRFDPA